MIVSTHSHSVRERTKSSCQRAFLTLGWFCKNGCSLVTFCMNPGLLGESRVCLSHPSNPPSSICGLPCSLHYITVLWASNIAAGGFAVELDERLKHLIQTLKGTLCVCMRGWGVCQRSTTCGFLFAYELHKQGRTCWKVSFRDVGRKFSPSGQSEVICFGVLSLTCSLCQYSFNVRDNAHWSTLWTCRLMFNGCPLGQMCN